MRALTLPLVLSLVWPLLADSQTLAVVPIAIQPTMDSLANVGRDTRLEQAGCVTRYAVVDSSAIGRFVIPLKLVPATNVTLRDSANLHFDRTICGDSLPDWHLHVIQWSDFPSPTDSLSTAARPRALFSLMYYEPDRHLHVYGVKREPEIVP